MTPQRGATKSGGISMKRSTKWCSPGLVMYVLAVARLVCLALPWVPLIYLYVLETILCLSVLCLSSPFCTKGAGYSAAVISYSPSSPSMSSHLAYEGARREYEKQKEGRERGEEASSLYLSSFTPPCSWSIFWILLSKLNTPFSSQREQKHHDHLIT